MFISCCSNVRASAQISCVFRVALGVLLCTNLTFVGACNKPSGSLRYLDQEFDQIQPLPNSAATRQYSSDKGRQGLIAAEYSTDQSDDAIKAYYEKELSARGWKLLRTEKVLYNGRDYGGQHVYFCKAGYTADLQLAGQQEAQFGWKYGLSLSWGLFDDCA